MIYEKLSFQIDIKRLQEHFVRYVLPLPSVGLEKSFGGWSALSSDGSYKDGWHKGHVLKEEEKTNSTDEARALYEAANRKNKLTFDYNVPTEI